jgi:putative ABC transport system permease protein
MFRNYIKIAFRNIWKSKGYAFINIVGLSVAFSISVFLFLTAYFALSFDNFHADKDRIYQVYFASNDPEKASKAGSMPFPITPALKAEFPEIEEIARVVNGSNVLEYKGKYFDKNIKFTDPGFLKIFSFPLLKGSREAALQDLSSIIITEHMAKAVFGSEDPMGKQVQIGLDADKKQYVVTGVLADFPENSSLKFDAFVRSENAGGYQSQKDQWDAHSHSVFVKLKPSTDQLAFEKRLKPFTKKYFSESITSLKRQGAVPDERGDIFAIRLQNLEKLHFDTALAGGRWRAHCIGLRINGHWVFHIADRLYQFHQSQCRKIVHPGAGSRSPQIPGRIEKSAVFADLGRGGSYLFSGLSEWNCTCYPTTSDVQCHIPGKIEFGLHA